MPDQSSAASEHALLQEITAPLETLPDDPLAFVEAEFPTSMRGYDRHAVDDYVEQVSQLVAELHATRSPESAVRRALERVGDQISGILQRAHETAEEITAQSRIEAEDRLEQARRESATMVDAAAQRVRELDADADRIWAERQRIIADAQDLSGQLQAVAREAAERFPPVDEVRGTPPAAEAAPPVEPEGVGAGDADWTAAGADDSSAAAADDWTAADADDSSAAAADDWTAADAGLMPAETEAPEPGAVDEPQAAPAAAQALDETDDHPGVDEPDDGEATIGWPASADRHASDEDDDIEATRRFEPQRLTDDDSTQIIPPASDAAQHRHDH